MDADRPTDFLQFNVKHPTKVQVWGGISSQGKTKIQIFKGSVDRQKYIKILGNCILSDVPKLFPNSEWVIQHDRATCHMSKRISTHCEMKAIPLLIQPPNSPDCNTIENVETIIDPELSKKRLK